jgi:hypothetical protein
MGFPYGRGRLETAKRLTNFLALIAVGHPAHFFVPILERFEPAQRSTAFSPPLRHCLTNRRVPYSSHALEASLLQKAMLGDYLARDHAPLPHYIISPARHLTLARYCRQQS